MQLFSADAIENMKKPSSKVAQNRPPTFFLCNGLAAQTAQKQKSRTTKSPLMQDWVFRLGSSCNKVHQTRASGQQGDAFTGLP